MTPYTHTSKGPTRMVIHVTSLIQHVVSIQHINGQYSVFLKGRFFWVKGSLLPLRLCGFGESLCWQMLTAGFELLQQAVPRNQETKNNPPPLLLHKEQTLMPPTQTSSLSRLLKATHISTCAKLLPPNAHCTFNIFLAVPPTYKINRNAGVLQDCL